jgi:NAD(P)-dependent dehydrogenase (short-subunit alcohol dehydrogenase family)
VDVLVNNAGIGPLAPAVTPSLKLGVHYENGEWFAIWRNMTPMARVGQPEEVAAVALFVCSPAASYDRRSADR